MSRWDHCSSEWWMSCLRSTISGKQPTLELSLLTCCCGEVPGLSLSSFPILLRAVKPPKMWLILGALRFSQEMHSDHLDLPFKVCHRPRSEMTHTIFCHYWQYLFGLLRCLSSRAAWWPLTVPLHTLLPPHMPSYAPVLVLRGRACSRGEVASRQFPGSAHLYLVSFYWSSDVSQNIRSHPYQG